MSQAQASFEVAPGVVMEYVVMYPTDYNRNTPTPFIISASGCEQMHVNGFSWRLQSEDWVVAVPLRPQGGPYFFEGNGSPGDGVWYLRMFCQHLMDNFAVESNRFQLVGVSNGGNSVLRFASVWPELVRGIMVVTGSLDVPQDELLRLQGLPIDMYVGTHDECGFYESMVDLEARLKRQRQKPKARLTVFENTGHMCSPIVDQDMMMGKMKLMLLYSGTPGATLHLAMPRASDPRGAAWLRAELGRFAEGLGLDCIIGPDGDVLAYKGVPPAPLDESHAADSAVLLRKGYRRRATEGEFLLGARLARLGSTTDSETSPCSAGGRASMTAGQFTAPCDVRQPSDPRARTLSTATTPSYGSSMHCSLSPASHSPSHASSFHMGTQATSPSHRLAAEVAPPYATRARAASSAVPSFESVFATSCQAAPGPQGLQLSRSGGPGTPATMQAPRLAPPERSRRARAVTVF